MCTDLIISYTSQPLIFPPLVCFGTAGALTYIDRDNGALNQPRRLISSQTSP